MRVSPALDLFFPPGDPDLIDLVTALLDDFGLAAIHERGAEDRPAWRVFFTTPAVRDDASTALTRAFRPRGLSIATIDIPDEDWAARSQASLRAVRVGRLVVAPPWDVAGDLHDADGLIVIQPSMGFGTGHHETTRLCLSLLQEIDCRGRTVLDVGTGSGVLALAAAALGARAVEGIDVDPDAVDNAQENLALNPSLARAATVCFSVADLRPPPAERSAPVDPAGPLADQRKEAPALADIVLANLTGALLVTAAPDLLARAQTGASLVLSGFQHHEALAVLAAFAAAEPVTCRVEGEWAAALLRCRAGELPAENGV